MSGIVGLYHLDSRPIDPRVVAGMLGTIEHRGTEAQRTWISEQIGIGHVLSHGTPESLFELQPLVADEGGIVLSADCRIDNRADLLRRLHVDRPSSDVTDIELLLAAYQKWGSEFPEKVIGPFAFAVWNIRTKELLCARDALGLRPLYYAYIPGRYFAFASEIKALLSLSTVSRDVDAVRMADYIMSVEEEVHRTFYEDVCSVAPAELLSVRPDKIRRTTFWALNAEHSVSLSSDDKYTEAFSEIFCDAVRCRMRTAFPLGTMLSGGLDSSSIAVKAREYLPAEDRLTAFSFVFNSLPSCDEREYMESIWEGREIEPVLIHGDELDVFSEMDRVLFHAEEPHIAENLFLHLAAWDEAHKRGIKVLLDGFFGDSTITFGDAWATELIKRKKWIKAVKLINDMANFDGIASRRAKLEYGVELVEPLLPTAAKRYLGRIGVFDIQEYWNSQIELVNPELGQRIGLRERLKSLGVFPVEGFRNARREHIRDLTSGVYANGFAMMNKVGHAYGVDVRLPFTDRRLVSFCVAIPPEQKILQGVSRSILRSGLGSSLPPKVRNRNTKADLGPNFERAVNESKSVDTCRVLEDEAGLLSEYVDLSVLKKRIKRVDDSDSSSLKWFASGLSRWLELNRLGSLGHNG